MEFTGASVIPLNGQGPEDVAVDAEGRIYTGLADGRIVRIADDGKTIQTIAEIAGRPYGIELYGTDELVVCAGEKGLLGVEISTGRQRAVATEVFDAPIAACNNAAVASDGTIYFTDSTRRFPIPQWRRDLIEQTRTGRLLRRNTDGTVDELLGGLDFANGVALAADESFVTVAETGARRLRRVWLQGERAGTNGVFVENLAGYPDNSSTGSDGLIWVAIPSPTNPVLSAVQQLPQLVKTAVGRVPERLQPGPGNEVSVVALDDTGAIARSYIGEIDGFTMLTGVRERDGVLYFGSLVSSSVVVLR